MGKKYNISFFMNYLNLVGQISSADKGRHDMQIIQRFRMTRNRLVHHGNNLLSDINTKLQSHELYKFLITQDVILAGSLGHIRIRKTKLLKLFADTTSSISDSLTAEIGYKFPGYVRQNCR
jgi:hypothetical protein